MINKKSVEDVEVKGKTVLVRTDLNEPVEGGKLLDDFKVRSAVPTVKLLLERGAKVILISHLGRPKGADESLSLKAVVPRLTELLGVGVTFIPAVRGGEVREQISSLHPGDVILLENVRFFKEEEANDQDFAQELASLADLFVSDAFATAHRAHASTVGVANFLPAVAGLLMAKEINNLSRARESSKEPLVFIIAGGKVSTKIGLLEHYLDRAKTIVIGGAMANTFLVAQGKRLGKSVYEPEMVRTAKELLAKFEQKKIAVILPLDGVVTDELSADGLARNIESLEEIGLNDFLVDIGPSTVSRIKEALEGAATVIWNGPLGVSEFTQFRSGSIRVAELIAESGAESYVGGGDTAEIIQLAGLIDKFTFVSTGGGAALEFLEGKELPGIAVLEDK